MSISADYLTLSEILQRPNYNYIVPIFQRRYSWGEEEYSMLWKDVENAVNDDRIYFMGAIVLQDKDSTPKLKREIIIDGQQRLTTLTLLIAAIRNRIKKLESNSPLLSELEDLIACPNYKNYGESIEGIGHVRDGYFRIHPSDKDRYDYYHIILGDEEKVEVNSKITQAYRYFCNKLKIFDVEKIDDFNSKLINNIGLVVIQLQNADNPNEVFSSLNQKGLQLTDADLIRNHLFEQIPEKNQKIYYTEYYSPFESNFEELEFKLMQNAKNKHKGIKKSNASIKKHDGDIPSKFLYHLSVMIEKNVFPARILAQEIAKKYRSEKAVVDFLKEIKTHSSFYRSFLLPEFEHDKRVRQALYDIARTGETTFYPLLLMLFNARHEEKIDNSTLSELIGVIENFIVREKLLGKKGKNLNREFPRVIEYLDKDLTPQTLVKAIVKAVPTVSATNDEIKHCALDAEFYGKGKNDVLRLIFIKLNRTYNHDKGVYYDDVEIEHILPQNWENWRSCLSNAEIEKLQKFPSIVHRLGNFTLINSDYNRQISNRSFSEKKKEYLRSPYALTQEVGKMEVFSPTTIERRTGETIDKILNDVYPDLTQKYNVKRGTPQT